MVTTLKLYKTQIFSYQQNIASCKYWWNYHGPIAITELGFSSEKPPPVKTILRFDLLEENNAQEMVMTSKFCPLQRTGEAPKETFIIPVLSSWIEKLVSWYTPRCRCKRNHIFICILSKCHISELIHMTLIIKSLNIPSHHVKKNEV